MAEPVLSLPNVVREPRVHDKGNCIMITDVLLEVLDVNRKHYPYRMRRYGHLVVFLTNVNFHTRQREHHPIMKKP